MRVSRVNLAPDATDQVSVVRADHPALADWYHVTVGDEVVGMWPGVVLRRFVSAVEEALGVETGVGS